MTKTEERFARLYRLARLDAIALARAAEMGLISAGALAQIVGESA